MGGSQMLKGDDEIEYQSTYHKAYHSTNFYVGWQIQLVNITGGPSSKSGQWTTRQHQWKERRSVPILDR